MLHSRHGASRERQRGVRVQPVSPGVVQTPILATFHDAMGADLLTGLRRQAGGRDAQRVDGIDLIADGGADVSLTLEGLASPA